MYALDISNYQGEVSAATVACWKAAGIEHVIVRASLETVAMGELAQRQARVIVDGGLGLSAYVWAYWGWNPEATARAALRLFADLPVQRWWVDAEESGQGYTPDQLEAWLERILAVLPDQGIYTGAWWWNYFIGESPLARYPLWDANYDGLPQSGFVPYGGWTKEAVSQFSSSYELCGYTLDINWIDDAWLAEGETVPGKGPTREEFDALQARLDELSRITSERYTDDHGWLEKLDAKVNGDIEPRLASAEVSLTNLNRIFRDGQGK